MSTYFHGMAFGRSLAEVREDARRRAAEFFGDEPFDLARLDVREAEGAEGTFIADFSAASKEAQS
jgi:hypothetical protein